MIKQNRTLIFSHFILTRFNVKNLFGKDYKANLDKAGIDNTSESYMKYRFEIFEKYCLPSIDNQTNKNFTWLVYYDMDTDKYFLDKINIIKKKYSFFQPVFVEDFSSLEANYKYDIDSLIKEPIKFLITTIIDNDDCLHKNVVQDIQNRFNNQELIFFNFYNGYMYDLNKKIIIQKGQNSNGNGTSLIERFDLKTIKTAWCTTHAKLQGLGEMVNIHYEPYWIQLIHDRNNTNDLFIKQKKIYKPLYGKYFENNYGIDALERSFTNFILYYIFYYYKKIILLIKFYLGRFYKI